MRSGQISDYGLLADGRSAALVDQNGSVNWWCPGRFDAPSVFARLLDDGAGHWSIRPEDDYTVERRYLDDTLVLRTVFRTARGEVALTDALALEPGARGHDIGMESPQVLVRSVRGLSGTVPMRVLYRPRFEYGRTTAYLIEREDMLEAIAGAARLTMRASVRMNAGDGEATATFTVRAGTSHTFTLGYAPTYDSPLPQVPDADSAIADTVAGWRSWADQHNYQGLYADQVRRSRLVLRGMTYGPSGAVVASVTTSLPEKLGGNRNYDYRYVWVRDFSLTLRALWRSTCYTEVQRQFAWLGRAMGRVDERPVPIMYGVLGERDLTEHRLDQLGGYRDSPPVVIGNDAWQQRQTDIFGETMDAAWLMRDDLEPLKHEVRHLLRVLADEAARNWKLPDAGMWEERGVEHHHVSSKVQCWVALDRAVRFGDRLGEPPDVARWAAARDEVRAQVLTRGWSERLQSYTGRLDTDDLDASVLIMPLVGFLRADDPRMRATIHAVERQLSHDGLLRRWDGDPAGFLICSFWLVCCLALAGERDRAHELFHALAGRVNDLGLFAEQIDPLTGEQVGNFPQAFSHIGLINAAGVLTDVERDPTLRSLGTSPPHFTPARS
ncbi:glycoside hydrolase family 15 protein [Micromonospora sp. WMMD1120]|uniref:glycoside hydrolase family 15 protein n=1 Tax=Micromonospora sp. WMMD1120 TaxID=3016106 RepID=UPI002417F56F|nr:glycoside hydrolase family 15 protein [Micromonospora sp. WMMD1120]MDG4809084.1 glycoside hydrolase family 15 protein [Micromonospora sp. WMMD1120]